ncbi:MAG: CvpA family protein [Desulfobacteraceae bacterium]|nr:CvpA family protein [Desulfobacteraceae bacterium]
MNLLDLIIIATMIFLIIRGIFRGFFMEVGSLAGVILGVWLANHYQPQMTDYLRAYLPSGKFLPMISFALIFVIVLVLCNLSGWSLKLIMKKAFFGWADRTLGAGLAILKGIIITYLVIVLLTFFVPSKTPLIAQSRLAPLVITSYQSMISLISPGVYQRWKKKFLGNSKVKDAIVPKKSQATAK